MFKYRLWLDGPYVSGNTTLMFPKIDVYIRPNISMKEHTVPPTEVPKFHVELLMTRYRIVAVYACLNHLG